MSKIFIKSQRITEAFLIARCPLSFEHGHLVVEVFASLFVGHKRSVFHHAVAIYLTEIILKLLENAAFGSCIALEVITLAELLDGFFLFT